MELRRERWLAVLVPIVFLVVVEVVRALLLEPLVSSAVVRAIVLGVEILGVVAFTIVMFRALSATQERVTRQNRQLAALDEASIVISSELSVDRVLQRITDITRELVSARFAALGILGPDGDLTDLITSGLSDEERAAIGPLPRSHGILGRMLREGHAVRLGEVAEAPGRSGFPPNHPQLRSLLGVPIAARNVVLGDLYLADKLDGSAFTNDDERLIVLLAAHAAVAIENARLYEQVQRIAVLEERDRIGRDLHDGTIQSIYGVGLTLEDAQDRIASDPDEASRRIDAAIDALNAIIRDLRGYILDLRPQLRPGTSLREGLEQLVREHRANTLADVQLDIRGEPATDPDLSWQLLQIAREALSNVARHAAASRVIVRLDDDGSLEIIDNGRGFSPGDRPAGQGLRNIADRAASFGGRFQVTSSPGAGARVRVNVPIEEKTV
jgi:signal transduction histidine kinase